MVEVEEVAGSLIQLFFLLAALSVLAILSVVLVAVWFVLAAVAVAVV